MRYILVLTGVCLLSFYSFAQDTSFIQPDMKIPSLTVKSDILNLAVPLKSHASIGFDFRLKNRLSLDIMAGSYIGSEIFAGKKDERYIGPRLRVGITYLAIKTAYNEFHIGLQSKTDYIFHYENALILRQGGQYSEIYLHKRNLLTNGLGIIYNNRVTLTDNKKLFLNYFVGFGAQRLQIFSNWPEDAEVVNNPRQSEGVYIQGYFTGGIHLGYILR